MSRKLMDKPVSGPFYAEQGDVKAADGRRVAWLGFRKKAVTLTLSFEQRDRIVRVIVDALNKRRRYIERATRGMRGAA